MINEYTGYNQNYYGTYVGYTFKVYGDLSSHNIADELSWFILNDLIFIRQTNCIRNPYFINI